MDEWLMATEDVCRGAEPVQPIVEMDGRVGVLLGVSSFHVLREYFVTSEEPDTCAQERQGRSAH